MNDNDDTLNVENLSRIIASKTGRTVVEARKIVIRALADGKLMVDGVPREEWLDYLEE